MPCPRGRVRRRAPPLVESRTLDSRPPHATRAAGGRRADRAGPVQTREARCIRCSAAARWRLTESRFGSSQESRAGALPRSGPSVRDAQWRLAGHPLIYAAGSAASSSSVVSVVTSVVTSVNGARFESMLSLPISRLRSRRGASRHNRSRSYFSLVSGSKM